MLAVSKRLIPASRHMSTCLFAPATSVEPTLLKPPCPPKVIVPRVRAETKRPELPRRRYSIGSSPNDRTIELHASLARLGRLRGVSGEKPCRGRRYYADLPSVTRFRITTP